MLELEPIENLEAYISEMSKGFSPIPVVSGKSLSPDGLAMIEQYQLGVLADEIAMHRAGTAPSQMVTGLIQLCDVEIGEPNVVIFRAISDFDRESTPQVWDELSLSGWSLYPSIALRIALGFGEPPIFILRRRVGEGGRGIYLGDFEHEVLMPPHSLSVGHSVGATMNFLGCDMQITMVDCSVL